MERKIMNRFEECAFLAKALVVCYLAYKRQRKNDRRKKIQLYQIQKHKGFYDSTFKFIKAHDPNLFFKATRMAISQYNLLLSFVSEDLKITSIMESIEPERRLAITLIYLSQGVTMEYLARTFRLAVSTVEQVIIEVSTVLWKILAPIYLGTHNKSDWTRISEEFYSKWKMPNCLGSVDGKCIKIKRPPKSDSEISNSRHHSNIVLLGSCNADYIFTTVDVGAFGSHCLNDGGIFKHSCLGGKILRNELDTPPPRNLPNSENAIPYMFAAGDIFPLRCNIMRPYPGMLLSKEKEVFNYRLTRARRVIENAFGILSNRWRVLVNVIEFDPKNAKKVVLACIILHNFLKTTDKLHGEKYCPKNYCDSYNRNKELVEGLWRKTNFRLESMQRFSNNNSSSEAFPIRDILAEYFMNEGRVSLQP